MRFAIHSSSKRERRSVRLRAAMIVALLVCVASARPASAQSVTLERVDVQGLLRMSPEAFRHALQIKAGDPFDLTVIRTAFRRLWDMNLFSDITMEAETTPSGNKILVVKVVERAVLASVSFEENKVLTRTQIEDRLKDRKVSLDVGKPLDTKAVADAEAVIRDQLAEKGYLDAKVSHRLHEVTQTSRGVSFSIRPGSRTRIRKIDFVGNRVFSDRRLKKLLTLTRPWRWWVPWSAKSLYHPVKWDQDVGSVRDAYQDLGFLDVEIRPPSIEVREVSKARPRDPAEIASTEDLPPPAPESTGVESLSKKAAKQEEKRRKKKEKARKKREKELEVKRWVYLTVPISEGEQYRTGAIGVSGNTVFSDEQVLAMIPLREGGILSNGLLRAGINQITRAYGNKGYLYATAVRQIRRRPDEEKVADIQVAITEDKPYYVGRIEFRGNTSTQDRVLRREVRLNEGDLFNRSLLDISKTKVNQLGYFEVRDEPVIEPIEGENRVRIRFIGEEKGRNEIQVGGGYSGLDGAFFTGYYSTRNLLGRGQILSTSVQVGGRSDRYQIQFIEPWFLNRPYSLGFSLFRTSVDFGGSLTSSSRGGGIRLGRQFGFFTFAEIAYDFQSISSTGFSITRAQATNRISSLTPSFLFNKVNNPYRPTRGWSIGVNTQVAGSFLGGDTSFFRPIVNYSGYRKAFKRSYLGVHGEIGLVRPIEGDSTANSATVNGIPRFQRFWLGGDTLGPRVFDVRTITPLRFVSLDPLGNIVDIARDPRGQPASKFDRNGDGVVDRLDLVEMGGDRFFLLQAEYVYPLNPSVEAALFVDVGNSMFEDASWGFADARVSAGVEMRFYLPVFPVPLRLIYGFPLRKLPEDRTSSFTFSIGKSF